MTSSPTKLVLEITSHSGDGSILYRTIEHFPATLGRGYHNDIILSDPHVSPRHLFLDFDGESWHATDLGSDNGLFVNEALVNGDKVRLSSGDVLRTGRTEIRVYDPAHPVPGAVLLQKANPLFLWLSRGLNVWLSFLLALGSVAGWTYLEVWEYRIAPTIAWNVGIGFGLVFIWAGLWAVTGRLIRHKPHFQAHVALASLYLTASTANWYLETYLDFLTGANVFTVAMRYGSNSLLLAVLLYGALSLATDMTRKRRAIASLFFSGGVAASVLALGILTETDFSPEPGYSATLEPYLTSFASADTAEGFFEDGEVLFSAPEFSASPSQRQEKGP